MHSLLPRIGLTAVLGFSHVALSAQTSVTYTADENKTEAIVLDAVGDPATLTVATGTATQSGNISESGGSFGFTKDGAGSLILSGANTYTGTTTIAQGVLQTGTSGALGGGGFLVGPTAALHLTGGTHTISSLTYNLESSETTSGQFLVVSNGAVLNSSGLVTAYHETEPFEGILVTGAGSRLTAPRLNGFVLPVTLTAGGTLELTDTEFAPTLGKLFIGAAAGSAAAAPGYLVLPSGHTSPQVDEIVFNHTATDYWFSSDGTATGTQHTLTGGNYGFLIAAGTTIFNGTGEEGGGSLSVTGGEARFLSPTGPTFQSMHLTGGIASFNANPFRASNFNFILNGGTFRAMESFTITTELTHRKVEGTGTFSVDAGKTLRITTDLVTTGNGAEELEPGQALKGSGTYTKTGAGTLSIDRGYMSYEVELADFVVREGTLRTFDYVFDEVVVGKFAGDNGHFTLSPTNPGQVYHGGTLTSLGFLWASYWDPVVSEATPQLAEFDEIGVVQSTDYFIPVAQSRNLMIGEQAEATGHLTLNESTSGGWYVHDGTAVIGGAGTGHVTLVGQFLYNNDNDIIVGQSAGGVGHVTVSGANGQLNAGLDLVPLAPQTMSYSGPPLGLGVGNIIIGQGGTGHVSVTNNARIMAGHTFIGDGSDLTLGSGGTIYGGFTAQDGSTVEALDGATFAFTLGTVTEASVFQAGSTFLVGAGADLIFAITEGDGFGFGTYTLFDFAGGATLTGLDSANFLATGLGGYSYTFDLTASQLDLTVSAIPEPSTYALLAGALGLVVAVYRRRRPIRSS